MGIKICLIGAGSATFSLNLIKDICITPNLKGSKICLMDINSERLENAYEICIRYAAEVGAELDIEKTTDRATALIGADHVINCALATGPGWRRLKDGWEIAQKYGYRFGGSLHIMHDEAFWINFYQLQLMESIVKDILVYCPDAWYILVANPVQAGVTYLTRKYPTAKIVGMCNGYSGIYKVSDILDLDPKEISYEMSGINHFIWLTKFEYKGVNAIPLLEEWIKIKSAEHFESCSYSSYLGPKVIDLYKLFGILPIGDTANPGGGAWGYWYHKNKATENFWNEDVTSWFYIDYFKNVVAKNEAIIKKLIVDPTLKVTEAFSGDLSGEPMIPLIESLSYGVERTIMVNISNKGNFVESVPLDYEVEIPALVNAQGIMGQKTQRLPANVISFLKRDYIIPIELELKAFESGSKSDLLSLILMDPWTTDITQAERFLEEILDLPYHLDMKKHFR